jgi:uncharacterized protein
LRVWIDSLTPKHALFFTPLRQALKARNHEVLVTTRKYREAVQTLQLKKIPFTIVGEHGGGTAYGKLTASAHRITRLAELINTWKPDIAVSFSSPEAARVAFGLAIPHIAANDSPHAWRVAKLTVPLSHYVCYPWIIPRTIWEKLGANRNSLAPYRALDAAAWLKGFKPDPRILPTLGLDPDRPIIFLRTEEAFAAYLMDKATDKAPVVLPIIKELLKRRLDAQIVVSTRYGLQAPILKKTFHKKITVLDHIVDSPSLLAHSAIFIGSGGTMTVEAALLGTIAISCFPGQKPLYISYLEKKKLVDTIFSPKLIVSKAAEALTSPEKYATREEKGRALLNWMEDPAQRILGKITDAVSKPSA